MTILKEPPIVYNAQDLEDILKLSKTTIQLLLRTGRIRSVRPRGQKIGKYLVTHEALLAFLNEGAA